MTSGHESSEDYLEAQAKRIEPGSARSQHGRRHAPLSSARALARATARPATGRLFRGGGCEVAGVKPIKIYHYAKNAVIPLP